MAHALVLRGAAVLDRLVEKDVYQIFWEPVDPAVVVGYLDVIKNPMDLSTCRKKLERGDYKDLDAMRMDVDLIWTNCCTFNPRDTVFFKQALKLRDIANRSFRSASDAIKTDKRYLDRLAAGVLSREDEERFAASLGDLPPNEAAQPPQKRRPGRPKGSGKKSSDAKDASLARERESCRPFSVEATPGVASASVRPSFKTSISSAANQNPVSNVRNAVEDGSSDESSVAEFEEPIPKKALPYPRPPSPPARHFPTIVSRPRGEWNDAKWHALGSKPKMNPVRPLPGQTSVRTKDFAASLTAFVSTCDSSTPRDIVNELLLPETVAAREEEARMRAYHESLKQDKKRGAPEASKTTSSPKNQRATSLGGGAPPVVQAFSSWVANDILEELEDIDHSEVDAREPFGVPLESLEPLLGLIGKGPKEFRGILDIMLTAKRAKEVAAAEKRPHPGQSSGSGSPPPKAPRTKEKPSVSPQSTPPSSRPSSKASPTQTRGPEDHGQPSTARAQHPIGKIFCKNCKQQTEPFRMPDGRLVPLCQPCGSFVLQYKVMKPVDSWAAHAREGNEVTGLAPADLGPAVFRPQAPMGVRPNPVSGIGSVSHQQAIFSNEGAQDPSAGGSPWGLPSRPTQHSPPPAQLDADRDGSQGTPSVLDEASPF